MLNLFKIRSFGVGDTQAHALGQYSIIHRVLQPEKVLQLVAEVHPHYSAFKEKHKPKGLTPFNQRVYADYPDPNRRSVMSFWEMPLRVVPTPYPVPDFVPIIVDYPHMFGPRTTEEKARILEQFNRSTIEFVKYPVVSIPDEEFNRPFAESEYSRRRSVQTGPGFLNQHTEVKLNDQLTRLFTHLAFKKHE